MFFLQSSLLARLCLRLVLSVWSCQNKTLIYVCDVIIIQVLRVVFVEVSTCRLLVWWRDQWHTLWDILGLIYDRIIQAFVFHRLVQYLLHIHWTAHVLLHINRGRSSFVTISWGLIQNALNVAKFGPCKAGFLVVCQIQLSLIDRVCVHWSSSRWASLVSRHTTTVRPVYHIILVRILQDRLTNVSSPPHHRRLWAAWVVDLCVTLDTLR